jgi:putative ABC transport system permease protein
VVFQFASAIALIICTMVIYQQTSFARSVDLGFDKEAVLVLNRLTRDKVSGSVDALISELRRHPDTIAVSPTQHVPGEDSEGNIGVRLPSDDVGIRRTLTWQDVGHDFYSVLSVDPVAGRVFSRDFPADALTILDEATQIEHGAAVINVAAVRSLGFREPIEAVGQRLFVGDGGSEVNVIGVVPDLRYRSVRQPVRPSIYMLDLDPLDALLIKYSSENTTAYLQDLKQLWLRVVPDAVIQWEYLDEKLDALYGSEERWADMFFASSLMAVFISVLGLFGLTTFAIERRTLEVGVRKILGAKARQIVGLFSWQFTKPLILANLVAWPLAWYFMREWLGNFAIRIELNVWPFVLAAALVFLVAWITVATCSYRIARTRPVQTLRHQ